jgi:hypothetical protein
MKLSKDRRKGLIEETGVPGVSDKKTEEQKFDLRLKRLGGVPGAGGVTIPLGGPWMGVRWTPDGLPDCQAEVVDLMLNTYRWDDIKDQRNFTFYKDELIDGRFVVSGQVRTACPGELLQVDVSVDGGSSWVRALFSPEAMTFRYEFDPAAYPELDLRVRPSFQAGPVEQYRRATGTSK